MSSHIFIRKNTNVQSYKDYSSLLKRGLEEGNVVSMVVGVPSHLWEEKHIKWVNRYQTLERKVLFIAEFHKHLSMITLLFFIDQ